MIQASHRYGNSGVPYGITQCYLPPGRGDIPAFTPANYKESFRGERGKGRGKLSGGNNENGERGRTDA